MTVDQEVLTKVSRLVLGRGLKLLQGYRLADTDIGHIARLLDYMQPKPDTVWLDSGAGFGEAARLMLELRPDLRFTLLNNNLFQLEHTPDELDTVFGDMHDLPFADDRFDGVMMLYSLCHADDLGKVFEEAARVTRPEGTLFVYDYLRLHGNNTLPASFLASHFHFHDELVAAAAATGWKEDWLDLPPGDDTIFRSLIDNQDFYDSIMEGTKAMVWRAVRQ